MRVAIPYIWVHTLQCGTFVGDITGTFVGDTPSKHVIDIPGTFGVILSFFNMCYHAGSTE